MSVRINFRSRLSAALSSLGHSTPQPSSVRAPDPRTMQEANPQAKRPGHPPLRARIRSHPNARCVITVVVGLAKDDLETVVARLAGEPATVPVFLTDSDHFEVFRRHRAVFEYLPAIPQADDLDVDLYRLRRLALLRRKWRPAKIVAFGAPAAELVRSWRASPFEDQEIAGLTGDVAAEPA